MEQEQERAETIIKIKNLDFSYGKKIVFDDLSFAVENGSVHGIVGDNGAGKTTLFKILSHNIKTDRDRHRFPGADEVAYLTAEPYFYDYMTGAEYLQIVGQEHTQRVAEWNSIFTLPLKEYVHNYSTGMKKKLAIIGVLLLDNPIVIMDEPFNGLDFKSTEILNIIIERLKEAGRTVLLSSHVLETLVRNSDKISMLKDGKINRTFEKSEFGDLQVLIHEQLKGGLREIIQQLIY